MGIALLLLTVVLAAAATSDNFHDSLPQTADDAQRDGVKESRRGVGCAPRGELRPEPQAQYSLAQVDDIFQHIKQRLDDLSGQGRRIKGGSKATPHSRSRTGSKRKLRKLRKAPSQPTGIPRGGNDHLVSTREKTRK